VFGSTGTSLSQVLTVDGNTVSRAGETGAYPSNSGIFLSTDVSGLAVATQVFTVTNNVATNVDNGLRIAAYAFNFATVSQAIDVAGNTFSDDADGIVIRGGVGFSGGTVSQGLTIADNTLSANSGYGLFVRRTAINSGSDPERIGHGHTISDNRFGRAGAIFHASGPAGLGRRADPGHRRQHHQPQSERFRGPRRL